MKINFNIYCASVNRKVAVTNNLKQALSPLLNDRIHYYCIPHKFQFVDYFGVCAMQYSLFSTQKELLPLRRL